MTENTFENNTGLKDHALVFLIYVVLIAAFYSPVLFSGKSLIPSLYQPHGVTAKGVYGMKGRTPINSFNVDLATPVYYEAPVNKLIGDMYREGKVPLWNPYQAGGTPLAAQYSTRAFFPYQIAEDLAPVWSWDYFILGRLLIAGFFTYLFIISLGRVGHWSAFAGGLFYMFSGVFTWFINLEQLVNTAMMLPLLLLAMVLLARGAPRARWVKVKIVFTAIIFAMTLLAGQPETALYCLALAGLFYLFRVLTTAGLSGGILRLPRVIIAFVTALGLTAPLIILFLELVQRGAHIHPSGGLMGTQKLASWRALFNIITPTLSYFPADAEMIKGTSLLAGVGESYFRFLPINGVWDTIGGYTGILPLFLILSAIFISLLRRKIPLRWNFYFFIFIAAFVLLKNAGVWPFILLGKAPMFDMVWSLRWASPVWVLSIAVAAALGLQLIVTHLDSSERESSTGRKFFSLPPGVVFILAGGLIAGLYIIYSFVPSVSLFLNRGEVFNETMRAFVSPSIIGGSLVTLIVLASAFSLTYFFKDENKNIYAILLLAVVELWWCIPRGYAPETLLMKWVPLGLGLLALSFFFRERFIYAFLGLVVFFGSAFFIDTMAPNGYPQRDDPFKTAPYVSAILNDSRPERPRVAGAYGALFPNYASAVKLDDVRYVNSVVPEEFSAFRKTYLYNRPGEELKEYSLWFTGRPERSAKQGVEGRKLYLRMENPPENDFIFRQRGYSMLGVGYFIFPGDHAYGGESEELGNVFEEKFSLIYSGDDAKVYKNASALPRVYLASNIIKASSWKEAQQIFMEGDFDPATTIVLEEVIESSSPQSGRKRGDDLSRGSSSIGASVKNGAVSFYHLLEGSGAALGPTSAEAATAVPVVAAPQAGSEPAEPQNIPVTASADNSDKAHEEHPASEMGTVPLEQAPEVIVEKPLGKTPVESSEKTPEAAATEPEAVEVTVPAKKAAEVRPEKTKAQEAVTAVSREEAPMVKAPVAASPSETSPAEVKAEGTLPSDAEAAAVREAAEVKKPETTALDAPVVEASPAQVIAPEAGPTNVKTGETLPTDAEAAEAKDIVAPVPEAEATEAAASEPETPDVPAAEAAKEAVRELAAPPLPPLKNNARILDYSESRVTVEVDSDKDAVLVLGDVFYPGWKVKVNDEKGRIIRVNGLVRGVPIKAGSSRVIFYYLPPGFLIGLGVMMLFGVFCIILIYKDIKGD